MSSISGIYLKYEHIGRYHIFLVAHFSPVVADMYRRELRYAFPAHFQFPLTRKAIFLHEPL